MMTTEELEFQIERRKIFLHNIWTRLIAMDKEANPNQKEYRILQNLSNHHKGGWEAYAYELPENKFYSGHGPGYSEN